MATDKRLSREWHRDNELDPSQVSLGHQKPVKWLCLSCETSWMAKPAFRSNDGTGCPECGKTRRARHGSLASVRADLLKEWDYERNEESPENITCGSGKAMWWACQTCGWSWSAVVKARALNGSQCPRCAREYRFRPRHFAKDSPTYAT